MVESKFKIKKRDWVLLCFLISLIIIFTYVWANHHQKVERAWYVIQLPFIKSTIKCSNNAPEFMYELMEYTITTQKSMNNQVVFQSKNGVMHHCESGWEDGFWGEKKISVNSRFRYASVTKVVTSALILELINQGKLNLNDKLIDLIHIPEPLDKRINKITVAMLLNHSAGFDRFKENEPMLLMGVKPYCPTDIAKLAKIKLDFEPNTQFQYSNLGYCLLGMIIEKKVGENFREVADKRYQLTTKNIIFVNNDFLEDEIQYDYRFENFYAEFYKDRFDFKESLSAVGGLSGSAKGMVLVMRDMLDDKPLNILSRSNSPCAIYLIDGCYGYALLPYQERGSNFTIYGKEGYFPGVETDVFVDDQGSIFALFRGATVPKYSTMVELRKKLYHDLQSHYKIDNK